MPRTTVWHATAAEFAAFAPFTHFGTRAQALMRCPPGGWLLKAEISVPDFKILKDTGSWSLKRLQKIQREGYDGVRYLNRFEGIPLERFEKAKAKYSNLDRLSDASFVRACPEAEESWILFDPRMAKVIAKEQPCAEERENSSSSALCTTDERGKK